MNILLAHFQIQDYGGIVNYSECLAKGLKENGHSVDFVMLKNKGVSGQPKIKERSGTQGWEYSSGSELWVHQKSGWEGMNQLNYVTDVSDGESWTADYDLVVYIVPVPTCSKATKGDDHWLKLFNNSRARQVAVVHDGNMQKLYPHLLRVCDKLDGIVCVHDAAFNSCEVLPVRRTFIPNPHESHEGKVTDIDERYQQVVSLQTFKRWKRVDDFIRAIPHMDEFTDKIVCGGGIEYHYMTSETKCKKEYMDGNGNRIWDNALEAGMEFKGYVTTEQRDRLLSESVLLIDPSWSKNYSQLGCHFNRVMVEAMSLGCVPVCTDLAMKNSILFKSGINYIEVPYDSTPEQYASILDSAMDNLDLLAEIQSNNLKMMKWFDKTSVAEAIIEFAFDEFESGEVGTANTAIVDGCNRKMDHFEDW